MADNKTIRTWEGRTLLDRDGGRIGIIDAIYLDARTGEPEWALVNTGLFGTRSSFFPLAQAFQSDRDVVVLCEKQLVMDAPQVDLDQQLSEAEERQLWRHYGLDYDSTGPATDDAATRLRRYVTTEQVEVRHEDGKPGRRERH
jgi:hypothetical protein